MNSPVKMPIAVELGVETVPFDGLSDMDCPSCRSGLDLSQPDPNSPDGFIGSCVECGGLFAIQVAPDAESARICSLLPVLLALRPDTADGDAAARSFA